MSDFIRLRQIALAVPELEPAETLLCALFGVIPCHHDERVHRYGLENSVLTMGTTFIEILAPTRPDTAVGRFLDRPAASPLRGAYMAIFDCSDLAAWRARVDALGIRVVNERRYERYVNMQLHPRDTGATLVEIHQNTGGEDLMGHYEPGGAGWQSTIRTEVTRGIIGAGLQSPEPRTLAQRWSRMLGRSLDDSDLTLRLDLGRLRFGPSADGAERLNEIDVEVRDPAFVIQGGQRLGCTTGSDWVEAAGVRFSLHGAEHAR